MKKGTGLNDRKQKRLTWSDRTFDENFKING